MSNIEKFKPARVSKRNSESPRSIDQVVKKYTPPSERRYLILFDATGSMGPFWQEVKASINEIITRLLSVAQNARVALKVVAYRDQDYPQNQIVESSQWSCDPKELEAFLRKIRSIGGGDTPESVDLALQAALQEESLSRIVLIGDAPPHADRNARKEAGQLAQKNIPVYSVLVGDDDEAETAFTDISRITGGKMIKLGNLNELFELITIVFVADLGAQNVKEYVKKYPELTPGGKKLLALISGSGSTE